MTETSEKTAKDFAAPSPEYLDTLRAARGCLSGVYLYAFERAMESGHGHATEERKGAARVEFSRALRAVEDQLAPAHASRVTAKMAHYLKTVGVRIEDLPKLVDSPE